MSIDVRHFDSEVSVRGLVQTPCRVDVMVVFKPLAGEEQQHRYLLVGWDLKGSPVIMLPDGTLGGLGRNMTVKGVLYPSML